MKIYKCDKCGINEDELQDFQGIFKMVVTINGTKKEKDLCGKCISTYFRVLSKLKIEKGVTYSIKIMTETDNDKIYMPLFRKEQNQ